MVCHRHCPLQRGFSAFARAEEQLVIAEVIGNNWLKWNMMSLGDKEQSSSKEVGNSS